MAREWPSQASSPSASADTDLLVYRIDSPHEQGSRWIARLATLAKPRRQALRPQAVSNESLPASTATRMGGDRIDAWLQRERAPQRFALQAAATQATETAFERSVDSLLAREELRAGYLALSQTVLRHVRSGNNTVLFVSLADELDAARCCLATAMLLSQSLSGVLLVDGDRHRRTLSILLQSGDTTARAGTGSADRPSPNAIRNLATPRL
jgi:hypothetical protein